MVLNIDSVCRDSLVWGGTPSDGDKWDVAGPPTIQDGGDDKNTHPHPMGVRMKILRAQFHALSQ